MAISGNGLTNAARRMLSRRPYNQLGGGGGSETVGKLNMVDSTSNKEVY